METEKETSHSSHPFEIGLVGAGAISAGAYTGGVIDFLIQALDCWYDAKNGNGTAVPGHDVKLSVFSGASAGGISAALATAYLASDQPSIPDEQAAKANRGANKLFDSWVEQIDISSLLESRDLRRSGDPVVSLLDSTVLPEIADSGLDVVPRAKKRPYVADDFELLLTITNLRGVPYAFRVHGDTPMDYEMSLHADHVHFRLNDSPDGAPPDRYGMSWAEFGKKSSPAKERLKLAALASGAFPVGLAPRILEHVIPGNGQPDLFGSRKWPMPTPESDNPHQCITPECIPVNWGALSSDYRYVFQSVDGGVMNNEPLELARQVLAASSPTGRNPRLGKLADKAVLLIDPFPNNMSFDSRYKPAPDLLSTLLQLFGALKNQARFKPEELMMAAKDDIYSRFMIAPSRDGAEYPIACGALEGFGGFLKRDFRAHDYFLGRRNAQKFLRHHFVLPEDNALFQQWSPDLKDAYCVRGDNGQPVIEDDKRFLPIIPLVGKAKEDCQGVPWPKYTGEDLDRLRHGLERRTDAVLDRLVSQYFRSHNFIVRGIAKMVIGRKKNDIVEFAINRVKGNLGKMGLMG